MAACGDGGRESESALDSARGLADGGGMDLDIPKTMGRPAKPITFAVTRHLEARDMQATALSVGSKPAPIARLRDSHHELAKCLALGMKPADASVATGYSLSRISILQADSTFAELIQHYRSLGTETFLDVQKRMGTLGLTAMQLLQERMEEAPEEMSDKDLREISRDMLDRIGYGPQTKSTNVNVNVDLSARLDAARQRAFGASHQLAPAGDQPKTLDITPND